MTDNEKQPLTDKQLASIGIVGQWLIINIDRRPRLHFFIDNENKCFCGNCDLDQVVRSLKTKKELKPCKKCIQHMHWALERGGREVEKLKKFSSEKNEYFSRPGGSSGQYKRVRARAGKDPESRARLADHYREMRRPFDEVWIGDD